jgi:hypothetical protein
MAKALTDKVSEVPEKHRKNILRRYRQGVTLKNLVEYSTYDLTLGQLQRVIEEEVQKEVFLRNKISRINSLLRKQNKDKK